MDKTPAVIDENTRFSLRFDNLYAIIACAVMIVGVFAVFNTRISLVENKLDTIIENQKMLSQEFREWKNQAETRLGTVESRQNTVISYLENHLQIRIIK